MDMAIIQAAETAPAAILEADAAEEDGEAEAMAEAGCSIGGT